jgi:hypothetical protein
MKVCWQLLLKKVNRISRAKLEDVSIGKIAFAIRSEENHENPVTVEGRCGTGIGRKFLLAILPEENHENLKRQDGGCVH